MVTGLMVLMCLQSHMERGRELQELGQHSEAGRCFGRVLASTNACQKEALVRRADCCLQTGEERQVNANSCLSSLQ